MRLTGRLGAAIDILDPVLDGQLVEQAMAIWARGNRYAGSQDRSFIRDILYDILRRKEECASLGGGVTARALGIGWVRMNNHPLEEIFGADQYAPAALSDAEMRALETPQMATGPFSNLPDWVSEQLRADLGDDYSAVIAALSERAPIDLRVTTKSKGRSALAKLLAKDGIETAAVDPDTALRVLSGGRALARHPLFEKGAFEFQDAHSQAVCASITLEPGAKVLDYCAGGGGKSLALADREASLNISAWDVSKARLAELAPRALRTGVRVSTLSQDPAIQKDRYDLVLLDVPCSGSGSWRRDPQGRWRLTAEKLQTYTDIQKELLDCAAHLCAPTGRIAYVTCSLFRKENEDQISEFLARRPDWSEDSAKRWSPGAGGDGFFLCILKQNQRFN